MVFQNAVLFCVMSGRLLYLFIYSKVLDKAFFLLRFLFDGDTSIKSQCFDICFCIYSICLDSPEGIYRICIQSPWYHFFLLLPCDSTHTYVLSSLWEVIYPNNAGKFSS